MTNPYEGYIPLSDAEIQSSQQNNNIRDDAVVVRTAIGGVVWILPEFTDLITQYKTGVLTGAESAPAGVILRALPKPPDVVDTTPTYPDGFIPPDPFVPQTPSPTHTPGAFYLPIRIGVYNKPPQTQKRLNININVLPSVPTFAESNVNIDWKLQLRPIPINLTQATLAAARRLLDGKVESYFDQDRINKTLLNFGEDYQAMILNWAYDPFDTTNKTVLVKLYQPLPPEVELLTELWITRELSPSYLDQIFVVFVPGEGLKLYLRPPNREITVTSVDGNEVNNVTLQTLLTTGSVSKTNLQDPILEEWFITSLEGAELNIDYTNFKNFVFYSSAKKRLDAFRQKLIVLQDYTSILSEQSASIAAATTTAGLAGFTSSLAYGGYERISEQRIDLLRSFDGYERFLYYGSGSAYSSSFSDDGGEVDQIYYISDATWPKINGSLISVASASNVDLYSIGGSQFTPDGDYDGLVSWWDAITYVAEEYDRQNQNRLANNLPEYLVNDDQSSDFLTFLDMIGHHFDVVKSYADAMPQIYNRNNDPTEGISPDMVWNIASSFGIDLPNQYAVKQLVDYTIGQIGEVSPTVYRQVAAETWKRFLHNQIYLLKAKGTKSALRGLLNTYGVLPTTIQIRESSTPSFYTSQSYELIEEQTNTLDLTTGSYVAIPFSGSGLPAIQSVQVRFAGTNAQQTVLWNVDDQWGVRLVPLSSSYGQVAIVNAAGTNIATSDLFKIYDGNYYTVTVQRTGSIAHLYTQRADDDGDIIDSSHTSGTLNTWLSGSTLYLGSSGSTWGTSFVGNIDEFRLWSEYLTTQTIDRHVQYAGLYNGNDTGSAKDNLPVRLSFNKPRNLGSATASLRFVPNESPYIRVSGRPAVYNEFSASGFANETEYPYSMTTVTRTVLRYAPNTGGSQFVSNKIVIADPATHRYLADDSGSGIPILSHEKSMVTVQQKFDNVQNNNIVGFYFSPTDAINDSIIRTIGNIDIQDYIGDPSDLYESGYSSLNALNELYWNNYAYAYNYNAFVEFVENLLQPLFVQARKLVPARAKLLTGLVIESPILERNKIKWNRIDTSGAGTFEEDVTPTLYAEPISTEPVEFQSEFSLHETEIDHIDSTAVDASIDLLEGTVVTTDETTPLAESCGYDATYELDVNNSVTSTFDTFTSDIDNSDLNQIEFESLFYDDETSRLDYLQTLLRRFNALSIIQVRDEDRPYFNELLQTFRPGSNISVFSGMNNVMDDNIWIDTIQPYVDFLDIKSTTYFTQQDGLVAVRTERQVRVNEATITAAGDWTYGTTYVRNQYVTQSLQTGAAADGNGYEYVCVTPLASGSFISYNPPALDTENWRKMRYTTVPAINLRVATNVSGSIQLAASGSGYVPFTGYDPKHYRFHRDTRLGTLRRIWYGCKQTDATTIDGGPAVEVIPSAGDVLVVSTGAEPIQRPNDNSGPILGVR